MEKLIIDDFLGIDHIELELGPITVLIGPQATGKSVCAKLAYFFNKFGNIIELTGISGQGKRELDKRAKKSFMKYFPKESWGEGNFRITHINNGRRISISKKKRSIALDYDDEYLKILAAIRRDVSKQFKSAEDSFAIRITSKHAKPILKSQVFIPANRTIFSIFKTSIFSFLAEDQDLDPVLVDFGRIYEAAKRFYMPSTWKNPNSFLKMLENQVNKILKGDYTHRNDEDFLLQNDRATKLASTSSGQQEFLPLAAIFFMISQGKPASGSARIYIEEPEAHLFPQSQRLIVELMAMIFNKVKEHTSFFITTHSPYILTSFNNLIYAGYLSKAHPEKVDRIENILSKDKHLKPDEVRAYSLSNGTAEEIVSNETGMILGDMIDATSENLGEQFDRLLELDE